MDDQQLLPLEQTDEALAVRVAQHDVAAFTVLNDRCAQVV